LACLLNLLKNPRCCERACEEEAEHFVRSNIKIVINWNRDLYTPLTCSHDQSSCPLRAPSFSTCGIQKAAQNPKRMLLRYAAHTGSACDLSIILYPIHLIYRPGSIRKPRLLASTPSTTTCPTIVVVVVLLRHTGMPCLLLCIFFQI
jgi:hypothetical protein